MLVFIFKIKIKYENFTYSTFIRLRFSQSRNMLDSIQAWGKIY